jgi:hypothetical protein
MNFSTSGEMLEKKTGAFLICFLSFFRFAQEFFWFLDTAAEICQR